MEEKESTVSGSSPGDSDTDSPPPMSSVAVPVPLPQVINSINMNMAAAENISTPPSGGGGGSAPGGAVSVDLLGKKKRGRPRKYDSDGNLRVQPSNKQQQLVVGGGGGGGAITSPLQQPQGFSFSPPSPPALLSDGSKRGRGRPPGSGNWQLLASLGEMFANTAGGDFTPHVVTVNTGEDVAGKILSLAQKGPRGICVLSANGAVSNVTIRQPGSSGGILTYEGRFEILSLSGSFTIAENGGVRSRTGGLSVSLASPDGRVIGGGIAGLLLAASPIQIVVGSFMPNGYKVHKKKHHREHTMSSMISSPLDIVTEARPISQAKLVTDQTALISASPAPFPEQNNGGANNNTANDHQLQSPANSYKIPACWNGLEPTSNQRPSPDINISIPSEDDVQGVL